MNAWSLTGRVPPRVITYMTNSFYRLATDVRWMTGNMHQAESQTAYNVHRRALGDGDRGSRCMCSWRGSGGGHSPTHPSSLLGQDLGRCHPHCCGRSDVLRLGTAGCQRCQTGRRRSAARALLRIREAVPAWQGEQKLHPHRNTWYDWSCEHISVLHLTQSLILRTQPEKLCIQISVET